MAGPGDRRRFPFFAASRGLEFEIAEARRTYDVVVVSSRADIGEWARYSAPGTRIVFDLVDSYLALPRRGWRQLARGAVKFVTRETRRLHLDYRRAIERMCERADAVVCSTREQAQDIRPFCPNTHVILDSQEEFAALRKTDYQAASPFKLVWEGMGENVNWFGEITEVLREVDGKRPLALHLITDPQHFHFAGRFGRRDTLTVARRLFPRVQLHPWHAGSVGRIATGCDLAVIPLGLGDPFARGKPENKLLMFWRMGLPALVSATPAYVRAMEGAGCEWLAASIEDWHSKLVALIDDESSRQGAARAGLSYVERHHSTESLLGRWEAMFASL